MSFFDALVAEQRELRRGELCTVARVKTHLTDEQNADLDRALAERAGGSYLISGTAIARTLVKILGENAYGIKGPTVQRHRRGACECGQ